MAQDTEVKCPLCEGKKEVALKYGEYKCHHIVCWRCKGTGVIPNIEIIRGMLFEAMIQDSVNLRQKLLWSYTFTELEEAGKEQILGFEKAIDDKLEEDYIIEEYKGHLKKFREWFKIFMMDLQVIYVLRQGTTAFEANGMVDNVKWII